MNRICKYRRAVCLKLSLICICFLGGMMGISADDPIQVIRNAKVNGGILVQVGSDDLTTDAASKDQSVIDQVGVVEGKSPAEWDKSIYFKGLCKVQVLNGADAKLCVQHDLPACSVFDGICAGKLLVGMVDGQVWQVSTYAAA